jgi:ABC-2 type transport system ATP-binding protein
MEEIVVTEKLTKNFGKVRAVNDLSLTVRKGEIYGFLGLNGSGKTTTIRMLLGMIRPASGKAIICGKRVNAGKYRLWADIGYLVEMPYSYPDLTVRENLEIVCELRGIHDAECIERVMEGLKLSQYSARKAKHLSLGNAQRLGLAKALLHNPSILLLDEPANGLDPAGIVEIRELLSDLAANHGVTVFISSHILGEIAKLANRIGIIHKGQLVQELTTAQLNTVRQKRLLIDARDREALQRYLTGVGFPVGATQEGHMVVTDVRAVNNPDTLCNALVKAGITPVMLSVDEEDLESYFLRMIGKVGDL